MRVQLSVMWAFAQWVFMKLFSGSFNRAVEFRYELKRGGAHAAMAIVAYILLSFISLMIVGPLALWLITDRETINLFLGGYFWAVIITFVYNVVKAAFECFEDERQDLLEKLRS